MEQELLHAYAERQVREKLKLSSVHVPVHTGYRVLDRVLDRVPTFQVWKVEKKEIPVQAAVE